MFFVYIIHSSIPATALTCYTQPGSSTKYHCQEESLLMLLQNSTLAATSYHSNGKGGERG